MLSTWLLDEDILDYSIRHVKYQGDTRLTQLFSVVVTGLRGPTSRSAFAL